MTVAERDKKFAMNEKFAQVVQKFVPGSNLLHVWTLQGGISAQVTALEIEQPDGRRKKLIVRQHGEPDLKHNPRVATDEFKLLHLLHSAGLAVPVPYYLDQSDEIFSTPYIVLEYIEGTSEVAPKHLPAYILQLATHLSSIHHVDCSRLDLSFLPQQERRYARMLRERPATIDAAGDEGRIRAALKAAWPFPQQNQAVLLHGDFWPGNILWQHERLVAIIDWEDAALGDPLADLANSRLEMLWAFGRDAMEHFTRQYQAMTAIDFTNLPYWDLCAALRPMSQFAIWAANESSATTMRERHRWFINQAFEKLAVQ